MTIDKLDTYGIFLGHRRFLGPVTGEKDRSKGLFRHDRFVQYFLLVFRVFRDVRVGLCLEIPLLAMILARCYEPVASDLVDRVDAVLLFLGLR